MRKDPKVCPYCSSKRSEYVIKHEHTDAIFYRCKDCGGRWRFELKKGNKIIPMGK